MTPESTAQDPKVAIVTGSSSGVGAATARSFAERGWNVVVNYRSNEEGARRVESDCLSLGAEVEVVQADVADDDACRGLVAAADDRWGRVDALINNAGTTKFCPHDELEGLDKDDFLHIYGVNVVGPYQVTRAAVPVMRRNDGGSVVNVASVAGVTGVGSSVAYAASKGALVTMTLSLARALGPDIRVNAVCPGFIQGEWLRSGLGDERYEQIKESREEGAALGITVTPEIVADNILTFVVDAPGVTGETLMVDGGHHLSGAPLGRR